MKDKKMQDLKMTCFFNEYAGFKVIYVYVQFMGVPLQFVNKHVFTVILLKLH